MTDFYPDQPWGVRLWRWRTEVVHWSQQDLVDRIVNDAYKNKEDRGTRIDTRLISKWENGDVQRPQAVYQRILRRLGAPLPPAQSRCAPSSPEHSTQQLLNGVTAVCETSTSMSESVELLRENGASSLDLSTVRLDSTEKMRLDRRSPHHIKLTSAAQLDHLLAHLGDQWHLLVKTDNLLGPRYALHGVLAQLQIIHDLLGSVRESARLEVVKLGAQYAESAAWLYEDGGQLSTARYWNSQAMEWAHEAGDRLMLSWTLFRHSQHAVARNHAGQVIGLAQAAGRERNQLPTPMLAAITQQEAQGYALDGQESAAQRKFDEAHEWATADTDGDARSGHGSFCTASYIELHRAGCWLTLNRPERAIQLYESTIPDLPVVYRRDRGMALARFAAAYTGTGEPEQAARVAAEALSIAQSTSSIRTFNEVVMVGSTLMVHRKLPPVAQFLDELSISGLHDG